MKKNKTCASAEKSKNKPISAENDVDDITMRSKSTISNTSHLVSKNKFESANKESKSLFGAAPANPSGGAGLFGKPPASDILRESPAFGNDKKESEDKK